MLIDSKTFALKKKLIIPVYDGYSRFEINRPHYRDSYYSSHLTTSRVDLNKNLVLLYKGKSGKGYAVSAIALNESFTAPGKPTYLFSTNNKCDGNDGPLGIMVSVNQKKDMCLFIYQKVNKKIKKNNYCCYVYNNNLQLLKADSIMFDIKAPIIVDACIYDNGYALITREELKTNFTATDLINKKTYSFSVDNNNNQLSVDKVQTITNDRIVFFGKYFIMVDKKRSKGGLFKIVYNTKNNTIESQLYYGGLPTASNPNEVFINIHNTIITPTGACYALIAQTIGGQEGTWTKMEVVCLDTDANKWKRQVPIPGGRQASMFLAGENLIISYEEFKGDNSKINYNNYAFAGNYKGRDSKNVNLALLKINTKSSYVQQQSFPDNFYTTKMDYNGEVIGLSQGINGPVYAKCVFFKIKLDD
jgi:hypothetical protein